MVVRPAPWPHLLYWLLAGIGCQGGEHEYRLTKYLLSNYEQSVRPVENSSLPLTVEFSVSLHQIVDVDEKNQILTTNCWLTQVWNDTHLTWNYSDFGGVRNIRLPFMKVWRPDVILYNNADPQYNTATINTNVIVEHTGKVTWLSHGMFKSSCNISVEYFPFDIQDCEMKWASWTYDGYSLDLHDPNENNSADKSNYQVNGEFELEDFTSWYHLKNYSCCEEPYPDITYIIRIRRRPLFYVFNMIMPCVLINGIALLVFYVPSESGEKVTLGISALLSMTVFLMTIRESLPPTEKTPLITLYYGVSICLVTFASAMAVVTLNIHHMGLRGKDVPDKVKKLVLGWLSHIVFLHFSNEVEQPDQQNQTRPRKQSKSVNGAFHSNGGDVDRALNHLDPGMLRDQSPSPIFTRDSFRLGGDAGGELVHTVVHNNHNQPEVVHNNVHPHTNGGSSHTCDLLNAPNVENVEPRLRSVLHKVSSTIDRNEERSRGSEKQAQTELEWKQVALVIDRLLLLIFFLAMTIASLVILTSSPHLQFDSFTAST